MAMEERIYGVSVSFVFDQSEFYDILCGAIYGVDRGIGGDSARGWDICILEFIAISLRQVSR